MPPKTVSFTAVILLLTSLSPQVIAQQDLAHVMVEKGLSKMINPAARRNLRINVETTIEKFNAKGDVISNKLEHKTTDGRLEVRGMNIEELYQAFVTRYDFYIDAHESTTVINGTTCAIVKFKPKYNLAVRKTADRFINQTEGSIYINLDNLNIVRIEGYIKNPFNFTFSWYFVPIARVDVYQFQFLVEYTVFNDMLVEQSLNGLIDYEIRNRGVEKFTNKISNHRMR